MKSAPRAAVYFIALALVSASPILAAPIRYGLIDGGGGDQGDHTLSGFIEFDLPCGGDCAAANVRNFSFTVSGRNNYSYSYQSPADVFFDQGADRQFLHASASALTIDYRRSGQFTLGSRLERFPYIHWQGGGQRAYYSSGISVKDGWGISLIDLTTAVIGVAVPEPSAVFLSITAAAIAGRRLWTTRRFAGRHA